MRVKLISGVGSVQTAGSAGRLPATPRTHLPSLQVPKLRYWTLHGSVLTLATRLSQKDSDSVKPSTHVSSRRRLFAGFSPARVYMMWPFVKTPPPVSSNSLQVGYGPRTST